MLRFAALLFGVFILVLGALGFLPFAKEDGDLFGIFRVNFLHNFTYMLVGFAALISGLKSYYASKLFFQISGIAFALLGLLGFYYWNDPIFGLFANNFGNTLLHLVMAAGLLFLGFSKKNFRT